MSLSEERIREIAVRAMNELGEGASPEAVKRYVENEGASRSDAPGSGAPGSGAPGSGVPSGDRMILTCFGLNRPGVVAVLAKTLGDAGCDIQDISQKIMQDFFTMIMLVDIADAAKSFAEIQEELSRVAERERIKIYAQHEDVFTYMHRV
ncbi:MAG: ACT domain-containing protein [Ignavibacteriales bacterium]|nr:ACT domain-containing protein [Ignavibacteriales bacterium]